VGYADAQGGNSMKKETEAKLLGQYIVADPKICHGKPTFRGTRIFVSDVLEMVAEGVVWETIIEQWHNSITPEAIAEAVKLSSEAFLRHADEYTMEHLRRDVHPLVSC
jgi:uncharacterized protein (DUF433 family)